MTLTEFLLARIAEDEAMAERRFDTWRDGGGVLDLTITPGPARMLADCKAKRRVVELATWTGKKDSMRDRIFGPAADEAFRHGIKAAMRALAMPYADHPDYQQDWKP